MVQEFHVLRCFACETFQVQQVKKAKKWNCKMCGEKQSVIKEFGRGSGAECRGHVQKLNSLRGKQLEEENDDAWSRWEEDEECEYNQGDQGLSEPHQSVGESRWSKYTETVATLEGDEEEEGNVYTESKRFGSQRNNRKRKRGRGARRGIGCHGDNEDDEKEEDQGEGAAAWRRDRGVIKPPARSGPLTSAPTWEDCTFSTPSFNSNTPTHSAASKPLSRGVTSRNFPGNQYRPGASTEISSSRPTGPATRKPLSNTSVNRQADVSTPHPVSKVNQPETKSSKWSRFLASPSTEDQEEDGHGAAQQSDTDEGLDAPWSVDYHDPDSVTGVQDQNSFMTKVENTALSSGLFGALPGLGNGSGMVNKLKSATACFGFVSATNQMPSPTFTTRPIGQEKAVCHQPPPSKRPCPGLAVSSLFQTDETFDDIFDDTPFC